MSLDAGSSIRLFQEKTIRSVWNAEEELWYFSLVDIVGVLTDSVNPRDYLKKLRRRDPELDSYLGTNCPPPVAMIMESGKMHKTIPAAGTFVFSVGDRTSQATPSRQRMINPSHGQMFPVLSATDQNADTSPA